MNCLLVCFYPGAKILPSISPLPRWVRLQIYMTFLHVSLACFHSCKSRSPCIKTKIWNFYIQFFLLEACGVKTQKPGYIDPLTIDWCPSLARAEPRPVNLILKPFFCKEAKQANTSVLQKWAIKPSHWQQWEKKLKKF